MVRVILFLLLTFSAFGAPMKLTSPAFKEGAIIPSRYTCEGANVSIPLEISGTPANAKSLALILEDPDVPGSNPICDHWVVFNIPPAVHRIDERAGPAGVRGMTTYGNTRYNGPCPPDREHRYFIKLYALDAMLDLKEGATKKELQKAMHGHIVAEAELMGRYEKGKGY
jgi:Raf kinase inhibitor-like YbhB/YbcL family protein